MSKLQDVEFALDMLGGLERRLRVTVGAERIRQRYQSRLREFGRSVNVRGYRPGKIPQQVLEQRFGEHLRREVFDEILRATLREALEALGLRPAGDVSIDSPAPAKGASLEFAATFEVLPDIELAGLEDIPLGRPEPRIDEADLDFVITRLREQHVGWRPAERPCRVGDLVHVNSSGRVEGEQVEGLAGEQIPIVLGKGRFLLEVEEAVVGMSAGEERALDVPIPADFGYADIAGRTVQLTVQLLQVSEPVLPELDADFMRRLGFADADPAGFRARVEQLARDEFAARAGAEVRRRLFAHLVAANPIPVPKVLIGREAENLKYSAMQILTIVDPAKARPAEHFFALAEDRVRTELLMRAICEANDLVVDPAGLAQALDRARGNPEWARIPEALRRQEIESDLREDLVAQWLERHAVLHPEPMSLLGLLAATSVGDESERADGS